MSLGTFLRENLFPAIATAAALGGGATVVQSRVDLASHDQRISRIEDLDKNMDELRDDLRETRETLIRVEARQQQE